MPDHECRESLDCRDEQIRRLRAGIQDAEIALRDSRALNSRLMESLKSLDRAEVDRQRAWAQHILKTAELNDWDDAEIAAYLSGIASAVSDA